jgi:hypothetical protein
VLSTIRNSDSLGSQVGKPEWRTCEVESDDVDFEELLRELRMEASVKNAQKLSDQKLSPDEVEGILAIKLHTILSELPAIVLTDPDFWRYVAVNELSEFVFWRDGSNCSQASFGLESARRIPDCVPLRMFNRIHIIKTSSIGVSDEKLQRLAISGGADFWQSHVFRVYNRFDARLVLQLLEIKDEYQFSAAGGMRIVPKEIRKVRANLLIESLQDSASKQMLTVIAKNVSDD